MFVQVGQAGSEHLILADARGGEGPNRRCVIYVFFSWGGHTTCMLTYADIC